MPIHLLASLGIGYAIINTTSNADELEEAGLWSRSDYAVWQRYVTRMEGETSGRLHFFVRADGRWAAASYPDLIASLEALGFYEVEEADFLAFRRRFPALAGSQRVPWLTEDQEGANE